MRNLFKNHRLSIGLLLLLMIVIAAGCFALYNSHQQRRWREAHPLSDPTVGFQMYTPAALPKDFKITGKRINVRHERFYNWDGDPDKIASASVDMNLRTGNWVYSIREWRKEDADKKETTTALTNYDPKSIKPTCIQRTSPNGRQYRLCHWIDYGRISVFEVKFIEGNTFIDTTFPSTLDRPLSFDEIDEYVDSFEKENPEGLPMIVDAV